MAKSGSDGSAKTRKLGAVPGTFPSKVRWEDLWEADLDLERLRAKRAHFEHLRSLAEDDRHAGEAPRVDAQALAALVAALNLAQEPARRLLSDAALIAEWYISPELQERIAIGRKHEIKALYSIAATARTLSEKLAPFTVTIEEMFADMPDTFPGPDEGDVVKLSLDLAKFARSAQGLVAVLEPSKRRPDDRRNTAIVLACQAVQEATGKIVTATRGTRTVPNWHFTNAAGLFVYGLMRELGWRDQRVLVGAFQKLARPLSQKIEPQ